MTRSGVVVRVGAAAAVGVATAVLILVRTDWDHYAPAIGWIAAATVFLVWTWTLLWRMDGARTRRHATEDRDSGSGPAHGFVMVSSMASLAGVAYLLASKASGDQPDIAAAGVGALSVVASWLMIHTTFTLRYAHRYYEDEADSRPIGFNEDPDFAPTYHDFAYLAFTVGMTYQVSDTEIRTTGMRREVLAHALLSFVLGAIILAIVINLVASLAG